MGTFAGEREKLRVDLEAAVGAGGREISDALTVRYDRNHPIRQRWLAIWSNIFLRIAGSKFRAKIIKE